jgi:hypothetical protein
MGIDVARGGAAKSVIARRQGLQMFPFAVYSSNLDSVQGAGVAARMWNEFGADACFIDATGGFGWGWIDQLRQIGKSPIGIKFSGEAHQKERFVNKRTEMYFDFVRWIKEGGALPNDPELIEQLTAITYVHKGDRLILEPKENVEAKIGRTLDSADAAALTFAEPVTPIGRQDRIPRSAATERYDPFAEIDRSVQQSLTGAVQRSYGRSAASDYDVWNRPE